MIRKTIALALSIPVCALAVACGGGEVPEAKSPETPATPESPATPEAPAPEEGATPDTPETPESPES
jgi:hypothetical protein